MKKSWKIKNIFAILGIGLLPIVSTSFISATINKEVKTKNIDELSKDKNISINSKNNYQISEFDYEILKEFYKPYYNKLGLRYHLNQYSKGAKLDKNSPYNKVGIIEVDNSNLSYLPSKLVDFEINKKENIANNVYDTHGIGVASLIGTDTGINKKANIFFTSLTDNGNDYRESLDYMVKNGVNIINMSFETVDFYTKLDSKNIVHKGQGRNFESEIPTNTYDKDSKLITDKWIFDVKKDITNNFFYKQNLNNYLFFKNLVHIINLYDDIMGNKTNYYSMKSAEIRFNEIMDEYIKKYNLIIVKSAGNKARNRNDFRKYWKDITEHYEDFKEYILYNENIKGLFPPNIQKFIKYVVKNNSILFKIFWNQKERFSDPTWIKNKLINAMEEINNFPQAQNVIYVGAVDYNNIPTEFSSYTLNKSEISPLISAYGEHSDKDDEFIKNNNEGLLTRRESNEKLRKNNGVSQRDYEFEKTYNEIANFNGTSMAAPIITGMLSLLQTQNNKLFNVSEAKTLLVASATYANTYTENTKYDDIKVKNEFWKNNRSKSKSGFGIPKYFKMQKFISNNMLKTFTPEEFNSSRGFNNVYSSEFIDSKSQIDAIKHTASFISYSTDEVITTELLRSLKTRTEWEMVSTFKNMYLAKKNTIKVFNDEKNPIDVFAEVTWGSQLRAKQSMSPNSNTEKLNFGNYKKSHVKYEYFIISHQLENILNILEQVYTDDTKLNPRGYDKDIMEAYIKMIYWRQLAYKISFSYIKEIHETE
ncbi:S8 family serine peptidase [Mycoplasma seminis]|uniref:S8 family serine peptidase n=1 Tax=Mycoplasma seminis TaxID=512749 RepID=A0ABY9H9U9_9MOLU|nr:S8 family serine peptidase [Mycoplasma seminis]WLP85373.1 S8 family serine peptidase [Mycoplasma seminis]